MILSVIPVEFPGEKSSGLIEAKVYYEIEIKGIRPFPGEKSSGLIEAMKVKSRSVRRMRPAVSGGEILRPH